MKKLIIKIFLTLSIFLSFGCNYEVYYKSVTDLSKVRAKTSMKPFEQINDPIVITMPVYEKMALFGNESMGTYQKRAGDMFVVYDWENNEIHDWCFFEGNHGWSNFRAVEMGTPVKYYDAGEKIGCLSSDGKLTTYKNTVMGTFTNLNNNQKVKSRYGILNTDGYSNGKKEYLINIFDSETGIINNEQIKLDCDYSYLFYPFADEEGNYWICNINDDKNWLNKIDGETNKIEKYLLGEANDEEIIYSVKDVYKNYVILREWDYTNKSSSNKDKENICIYDVNTKEKKLIDKVPYDVERCFFISIHTDNNLYVIFKADLISDEYNWSESTEIYELDVENKKIIHVADCDFDMTETVYSRGSRIYFLNSRNIQNFICTYYDTETGEWGEEVSITQEEIMEM